LRPTTGLEKEILSSSGYNEPHLLINKQSEVINKPKVELYAHEKER
jgi:hypothetical protein